MKNILPLFFILSFLLVCSPGQAQSIQFEYDEAGNCIEKYKTVVLPSRTAKSNKDNDSIEKPEIGKISEREVVIYPNPTKGILKIEIKGVAPDTPIQYLLMDVNGKMLARKGSGDMSFEFDMTSLSTGIYFLQVIIDEKWEKWKIIKE